MDLISEKLHDLYNREDEIKKLIEKNNKKMKFDCFLFRLARNKAKHTTGKIIYVILVSDG